MRSARAPPVLKGAPRENTPDWRGAHAEDVAAQRRFAPSTLNPVRRGSGVQPAISTPALRAAFAAFDTNQDGTLDASELKAVLMRPDGGQAYTDAEAQAVIDRYDLNGDGVMQIEEMVTAWEQLMGASPLAQELNRIL